MLVSRRIALVLGGTALAAAAGLAQRPLAPAKPAAPAAPAVVVPGPWANKFFMPELAAGDRTAVPPPVVVHDFGTVPHGTLCVKKFAVTNIYDVPIQVVHIRLECGCLKADPPQRVLLPNDTAEFAVSMDATKFQGKQSKKMFVTFGPNYVSEAVLQLEAFSRTDVTLDAPGEIDFGTLPQGAKATKQLVVSYTGNNKKGWEITGVQPVKGPFDVKVELTGHGQVFGTKYTVSAALKPDAPAGPLGDTVLLTTNDPASPLITVNVRGFVQAPLVASPNRVDFGDMKVGDVASHRVIVRSGAATKIAPVADAGDGFSVETFSGEAAAQAVVVKFAPTKAGAVKREIRLVSGLPGNPVAVVTVEANVTAK